VILLTRLNGQPFALNPDLLERAEATPDTVLTLVDGSKFVVADSLVDVVRAVEEFRAGVVARAQYLCQNEPTDVGPAGPSQSAGSQPAAVPLHRRRGR
jgi:flagellar protein FlbD